MAIIQLLYSSTFYIDVWITIFFFFQVLTIMNEATMNICVQIFVWTCFYLS